MSNSRLSRLAIVMAILGLLHEALSERTLGGVESLKVEDEVVYDVTMVTTLHIPKTKSEIDQIRVWHALPPVRPWSLNSESVGATELTASAGGEQQFNKAENSHHHFWDIVGRQSPGASYSFTTKFRVRSATRIFDATSASVNWRGHLHGIRPDWTNVHTWAEVYFPKVGWIEVEPSGGDQAYRIPARFIQNNPWFQNYAVWVKDGGKQQLAGWRYNGGKYTSPYNIENLITFEIRPN
jgi:hypothetical protein